MSLNELNLEKTYDSLGRGFVALKMSKAALVSALFRDLRSATHSETVETMSRAAFRRTGRFLRFFTLRAGTSSFFTIFIFDLSVMIALFLPHIAAMLSFEHLANLRVPLAACQRFRLRRSNDGCSKNHKRLRTFCLREISP
jgi:hypothetical protein